MSILAWIEDQRRLKLLNAPKYNHPASDGSQGLWTRCDNCGVILYIKHLKENQRVCFGCGFHLQMNSQERIDNLIDLGTWRPFDETLSPCDPLEFRDQKLYTERLREAQERTGLQDAIQTGTGMLDGIPIALGVMDFHFMGGSMGSAVGEKITRLIEYATQEGLTLILVCASGGARMQEGILSLMQMAKISAALQVYQSCANLLYISVLTSPTTGGVTASFAMLGDLIFAEPKALIGFAGRRVIEQTLQEQLPDDFQTSEYLLHHGLLDLIVPRSFLKQALSETITLYKDAPLKLSGVIPHGIQQNLSSVNQEKVRRNWLEWKNVNELNVLGTSAITMSDSKNQLADFSSPQIRKGKSEFSYREILLSFQTMFQFISFSANDSSKIKNLDSDSLNKPELCSDKNLIETNSGKEPYSRQIQQIYPETESQAEFLNKAISLASSETIQWRAFYMNSKLEAKKLLLNNLQNSSHFAPSPDTLEQIKQSNEKYFFYKMAR